MERVLPLGVVAPLLDRAQVADLHLGDHQRSRVDRLARARPARRARAGGVVDDRVGRRRAAARRRRSRGPTSRRSGSPTRARRAGSSRSPRPRRSACPRSDRDRTPSIASAPGADMVVDDVEDHAEAGGVRGIDSRASPRARRRRGAARMRTRRRSPSRARRRRSRPASARSR